MSTTTQTDRHKEVNNFYGFYCILTVIANKSDIDSAIPRTDNAAENTDRQTMTSLPVFPWVRADIPEAERRRTAELPALASRNPMCPSLSDNNWPYNVISDTIWETVKAHACVSQDAGGRSPLWVLGWNFYSFSLICMKLLSQITGKPKLCSPIVQNASPPVVPPLCFRGNSPRFSRPS